MQSLANTCCRQSTERAGTQEEDPRRPNVLAPVDAAARVSAARVSERAHVRRPVPSGGRALRTREEMEGEALFRGRGRCAASYALGG